MKFSSGPRAQGLGRTRLSLAAVALMIVSVGCSKEELDKVANTVSDTVKEQAAVVKEQGEKMVAQSKEMTDALVETVEEVLPESGKVTVNLAGGSEPLETKEAVAKLHVVGDDRDNSLQVTSYQPGADSTSSPSVFIHANTKAGSLSEIAGKTIACNLYLEQRYGGAVARNPFGRLVDVTFGSINSEDGTISGTFAACTLAGSDNQTVQLSGGEFVAVISGE